MEFEQFPKPCSHQGISKEVQLERMVSHTIYAGKIGNAPDGGSSSKGPSMFLFLSI